MSKHTIIKDNTYKYWGFDPDETPSMGKPWCLSSDKNAKIPNFIVCGIDFNPNSLGLWWEEYVPDQLCDHIDNICLLEKFIGTFRSPVMMDTIYCDVANYLMHLVDNRLLERVPNTMFWYFDVQAAKKEV